MIINKTYISKGGSEVTLECEYKEKYTITLADAKRIGVFELSEEEYPIDFPDDDLIVFLSQKLKAIRYCSYLLRFSDKSEKALRQKLKEKDYSSEIIDEALSVLRNGGIISDENLCLKKYISLANSKLYGPYRIKSELFAKGFSAQDIKNAEDAADIDFEILLSELCEKLIGNDKNKLCDRKETEKFKAKLSRYGYGFDTISTVIRRFAAESFDDFD